MSKKMSTGKKGARRKSAMSKLSKVTIGDIGEVIAEAAGPIRRFFNVEAKRFDTTVASSANSTAGGVACLTLIPQGGDYNERDGRSVRANAFEARFDLTLDPAKALTDSVRLIVFSDLENPGATPAVTDVLQSASVLAPFNANNLKRFLVFEDREVVLDTYAGQRRILVIKHQIDQHLRYRGTTGAIASAAEGALFYLVISSSAVASTSATAVMSRVTYVDN